MSPNHLFSGSHPAIVAMVVEINECSFRGQFPHFSIENSMKYDNILPVLFFYGTCQRKRGLNVSV